jgi:hypothetical protein
MVKVPLPYESELFYLLFLSVYGGKKLALLARRCAFHWIGMPAVLYRGGKPTPLAGPLALV